MKRSRFWLTMVITFSLPALMYAQLAGLALFRLIPGHETAPAADVISAFKTLARTALPAPDEGDPQ